MSDDINKQFTVFSQRLNRLLSDLTGPKQMSSLGYEITEIIRRRTRLGYGVSSEGAPKEPLAKLSSAGAKISAGKKGVKMQQIGGYVGQRQRLKKAGVLSSKTSPTKSNLTLTGKMLDELTSRLETNAIRIGFKTQRSSEIAGYHEDGTRKMPRRPFLSLSREDLRQVTAFLNDRLVELVARLFAR